MVQYIREIQTPGGDRYTLDGTSGKVTNCIVDSPNGIVTYSGSIITAKAGLNALSARGINSDGLIENFRIGLISDVTQDISAYADGLHYFFVYKNLDEDDYKIIGRLYNQYFQQETQPSVDYEWTWYNTSTKRWKNMSQGVIKDIVAVPIATGVIYNGIITSLVPCTSMEICTANTIQVLTGVKTFECGTEVYGSENRTIFRNAGYAGITIQSTLIDKTVSPESSIYHGIEFQDKNNQRLIWFGSKQSANTNITDIELQNQNGGGFLFPRCTTKPSTTSTASNSKVAVVIQNYVNGTSWYRVWSDGFIEQGAQINVTIGADTYPRVQLLKAFTNTNYLCLNNFIQTAVTSSWGSGAASIRNTNKTTTYFDLVADGPINVVGYYWYACGY